MKKILFGLLAILFFAACNKTEAPADAFRVLKKDCYSAKDERCYLEMTEYMVLKDETKLNQMLNAGKIVKMKPDKKVKIIKKKIDIALIEYTGRKGKRRGWIALKFLK